VHLPCQQRAMGFRAKLSRGPVHRFVIRDL
jgi:hypothetical protein